MNDEPRLENLAATPYNGLDDDEAHASVRQHYETFFDREGEELTWPHGAGRARLGPFRVLRIPPNEETGLWTYASVGAFALGPAGADSLEFVLLLPQPNDRGVELVTMVAHYHNAERLGLGHRFPIGEPWLPGATCNAFLLSVPYPFGATLEHLRVGSRQVRITWLLPITDAERRFAAQQGLEALEQRFDDARIEYWRLDRASVV
jgi:Suppressor of fused protein (SUFU)